MKPFFLSTKEWIAWLGATAMACAALTSFAFQSFVTKEDSYKDRSDLIKRLDRFEDKLDRIMETLK